MAASAAPSRPTIDLDPIAALCASIARVSEAEALPGILARTADLLKASGLVVWVADGDRPVALDDENVREDRMGWYDDPCGVGRKRFFTGVDWTHWVSDGTVARATATPLGPLHTASGPFDDELGLGASTDLQSFDFEVDDYLEEAGD